ncbi:hypothetical protein [Sulfitobacter sp. S190]|uniref:hypothetical protein n=1 Tax=Sulfitobacter sp. S190 TaxID=2867022 RepID=UPI0021A42407|nr:hypothetical protein [Sulfitobacter sp. S190]UWR22745.1 hypothetical protein K3756_01725 [Sulfitobacter sp. S190]
MWRSALTVLVAGFPLPALALSCMPYSVENAFLDAQASKAQFVVVRGMLDFDESLLPRVDWDNQSATPPLTTLEAELIGTSLTNAGFSLPFDRRVTLEIACFGPWCASAEKGTEMLAFVELGADGPVVATNPCGGYLFGRATDAMFKTVERCMSGGECSPMALK